MRKRLFGCRRETHIIVARVADVADGVVSGIIGYGGHGTCCRRRVNGGAVGRPRVRRDYPPDLSISISGGKETNRDSLSKGD